MDLQKIDENFVQSADDEESRMEEKFVQAPSPKPGLVPMNFKIEPRFKTMAQAVAESQHKTITAWFREVIEREHAKLERARRK